jgi:hypothetical protein
MRNTNLTFLMIGLLNVRISQMGLAPGRLELTMREGNAGRRS